ncbi:hypothetical protein MHYP_G00107920 [Metynnis hypsauchen]
MAFGIPSVLLYSGDDFWVLLKLWIFLRQHLSQLRLVKLLLYTTAESQDYTPLYFKENKPKPGRVKREQPEDIVSSKVRSSNTKAHRSHR